MTPDPAGESPPAPPPRKHARFQPVPASSWKASLAGWGLATFIRLYSLTLRFRLEDRAGMETIAGTVIWAFWHNRLLTLPAVYRRMASHRPLAGLTSPSKDGAIVAAVMKRFGIGSVRGSSNKRAAQALVECRRRLLEGSDLAITPDGPRGPVYVPAPGVIQLARLTERPLMPVQVHYSRKWRLKSWDRFQIPKPFSRVTITVLPPVMLDEESIEEACARLAAMLGAED